ncbi:response regulator [Paenibacillus sp. HB172176]|uniref:response regulator transcription factor n=1 Tax=Paenibacillus sp. HB172176 TaxID=2493690 RepID=UPI001439F51C|nr:response regulator [Paenibacillus sp. HB172176]
MWKILLVEDEPYIRRSLRKQIDWNGLGYEIIGEADDGLQALEIIKSEKPDLVITDIMMPMMDGLELLKQTRQLGVDTRFIMLTCVNEFDYAKEALEYGASGYVLKLSMSIESLCKKLGELGAELQADRERRAERFGGIWNSFYASWWDEYMSHRLPVETDSLQVAPEPSEPSKASEYEACTLIVFLDDEKAEMLLKALGGDIVGKEMHVFRRGGIISLFCWSEFAGRRSEEKPGWQDAMEGRAVVRGIEASCPERVREAWFRSMDQLRDKWYGAKSGYAAQAVANRVIPWELEGKLIQLIEKDKLNEAFLVLEQIWLHFEGQGLRIPIVKEEAVRLEAMLLSIMSMAREDHEQLWLAPSHEELLRRIELRLEEAQHERMLETHEYTDHEEINKIIGYIHQYYDKEITLKSMAELVNMDEHYVSGLFKRKTGDTLINFLQKYRIERAKRFLTNTDVPIHEIGRQVGFANDNYFSKIFRRWADMTPSDFRKLHT